MLGCFITQAFLFAIYTVNYGAKQSVFFASYSVCFSTLSELLGLNSKPFIFEISLDLKVALRCNIECKWGVMV